MLATALLLSCFALPPQEPLVFGVIARDVAGSSDVPFVRAARRAVDAVNAAGGVDGAQIELVVEPAAVADDVAGAIARLSAAGVAALVAPPEAALAAAAAKRNAGKLPLIAFGAASDDVVGVVDRLLREQLCMQRFGFVHGRERASRELARRLDKGEGLTAPTALAWSLDVRATPKKVERQFADERPELLVFDAEPDEVAAFLDTHLQADAIPVVLLPRAYGEAVLAQTRATFVVHGLSAGQTAIDSQFRRDYERDHGVPGFAAAEGYEAVRALASAFDAADGRDPAAVQQALQALTLDSARDAFGFDAKLSAFAPPLGVWLVADGRLQPYAPRIVPLARQAADAAPAEPTTAGPGTAAAPGPQTGIGAPFGKWRTRDFAWEEGSQWVLLLWSGADDAGFATADGDLAQLGLSTQGAYPLVDHLVKEEIFARVLAIVSTKFGRNEDGSAIEGQSLRICFGAHLDDKRRKKKKQRLWPARFGGDHEGAGGEAFGTFCRVYTSFIRRTIFQAHALTPPVSASDREFLDGTYAFGSDFDKDRRSELVRALINAYAGSMALTLAHEVGHLAGLGHVTDPPTAIMNVEEGAGIDYPDAQFCSASREHLEQGLGVVGATSARR